MSKILKDHITAANRKELDLVFNHYKPKGLSALLYRWSKKSWNFF